MRDDYEKTYACCLRDAMLDDVMSVAANPESAGHGRFLAACLPRASQ